MVIVFFDVEYTAWEGSMQRAWREPWEFREIVQIGATKVKLHGRDGPPDHFQRLVRPTLNPVLSDYFVQLTGIRQADVDREGIGLTTAIDAFLRFCDGADSACSNGDDATVMALNLQRLDLPVPAGLSRLTDIGKLLSRTLGNGRHITTSDLPAKLGLDNDEVPHQALGDAKALATTVRTLIGRGSAFLKDFQTVLKQQAASRTS